MVIIVEYLNVLHAELQSPLFIVLTSLICSDLVAGLAVAIMQKSGHSLHGGVESAHFIRGIWRKILNLCLYIVGIALSYYAGSTSIQIIVTYSIVGYEGISLFENFILLGIPFPEKLKKIFEVFKSKGSENDEEK